MLLEANYNEKELIDECYYDSSNILKSVCYDNENELKTLDITFKNGAVYRYFDIPVNEYLLFKNDLSQGVYFNKQMKKYKYELLKKEEVESVKEHINKLKEKK